MNGDRLGPTEDRKTDRTEPVRDPESRELDQLRAVAPLDDARVIEIGCGDGRLTWNYANQSGVVLAIDADRKSVAAARARLPSLQLSTQPGFAQAAAESLPVRREAFDLAIFAWSL